MKLEVINKRKRLVVFKIDLVVETNNKGGILITVDQLSKKCIIGKLSGKNFKKKSNIYY